MAGETAHRDDVHDFVQNNAFIGAEISFPIGERTQRSITGTSLRDGDALQLGHGFFDSYVHQNVIGPDTPLTFTYTPSYYGMNDAGNDYISYDGDPLTLTISLNEARDKIYEANPDNAALLDFISDDRNLLGLITEAMAQDGHEKITDDLMEKIADDPNILTFIRLTEEDRKLENPDASEQTRGLGDVTADRSDAPQGAVIKI